ncbi:3-oxoacyl-ACP synthase [Mesorhizobium sp. SEMIA 3007]|uniref:beta-ketoacyl synthase N-terminal-like domain-containing protein n=1 Tax=Mesorhizobium sp. SEMIA 3007 TaxID=1862350 RepID=UPI00083D7F48|nr:beta-ketoacyl synthase N-terminal-like domain-containing protein [Mesorhizobium sp. SEMIA 3007]ODA96437.1 3-oxoacyl-ACP synthase [Mesorhizobium sp. SEMIA 3007]
MTASLDIASIGMVTAVGLNAGSACAAMRAKLDGFQETRFIASGGDPLVGAPVLLPRKWIGEKRMAHMLAAAISEAFENCPQARTEAALILCLPEEDRPGQPINDNTNLLHRISSILEIKPNIRSRVVAHGRPSGFVALQHARKLLETSAAAYVVIAGVDSYLTAATIRHYDGLERLLTPANSNGFIPGEAAGAVVCCRAAISGLTLHGLGLARETAAIYNKDDLPLLGLGMANAYRAALQETGIEMNRLGYIISDLIGEQFWFKQTALATLRLLRGRHEFQDLWSPGESLGNIGAAAVPIMIGMAYVAAYKGYAAGNPVLIEASSDAGACGAAVLASRMKR